MAANTRPIFTVSPIVASIRISVGESARDGSGNVSTIAAFGPGGVRIDYIRMKAGGVTTAGMIRFFINNGAGTSWLWHEVPVLAVVPGATNNAWEDVLVPTRPLLIQSSWALMVSTEKSETFDITVHGGEY